MIVVLISLKELTKLEIYSLDGKAGRINDSLFDRKDWSVKYIVDKTKVLGKEIAISPEAITDIDWNNKKLFLKYSNEQIRQSPATNTKKLLEPTRKAFRQERIMIFHYDWVMNREDIINKEYAGAPEEAGSAVISDSGDYTKHNSAERARYVVQDDEHGMPSLQSTEKSVGLKISTKSGALGCVEDFIVDDGDWLIQFMIIDTQKYLNGKRVLVVPEAISWISWKQKHISIDLEKEKLAGCPNFNMMLPLVDADKSMLFEQYECRQFWKD